MTVLPNSPEALFHLGYMHEHEASVMEAAVASNEGMGRNAAAAEEGRVQALKSAARTYEVSGSITMMHHF